MSNSLGCVLSGVLALPPTGALGAPSTSAPIPLGVSFVQVSTCAVAVAGLGNTGTVLTATPMPGVSLPAIQYSGQSITIRNDGVGALVVWPGASDTTTAHFNGLAVIVPWFVAGNGGICQFVASSDSTKWIVVYETGLKVLPVATTATALTLGLQHNGCLLTFPAMGAACPLTLPAPASGFNFKAMMTGTAGFAIVMTSTGVNISGVLEIVVAAATACTGIAFAAAGQTAVGFTATAIVGDLLEFQASSLKYSVKGFGAAAASFAVA